MQYASGGDLHNYLQKGFTKITWNNKLQTLWQISEGLETIHNAEFIHRDFHSGNILLTSSYYLHRWQIGDLGLSQPANNTSSNNEIYGVIPYVAPEIFKGSAFSKESDIYSMAEICQIFRDWYFGGNGVQSTVFACKNSKNVVCDFGQAEEKRIELINSQKLGPEFVERTHSKAIYTSRSLNVYISKIISIDFSSLVSFENSDNKQGYISKELEFDIEL
ncbi:uncharacterized protein OCT59_006134 [Rhizophagus irregularis]|nr:hypothetical protein OCT59_006134 [Rhizophagus irregularis]